MLEEEKVRGEMIRVRECLRDDGKVTTETAETDLLTINAVDDHATSAQLLNSIKGSHHTERFA